MAKSIPFRGILYNQKKIGNLEDIVAPPYDVISKDHQEKLYQKNDYNVVRLILGKIHENDNDLNNRYTRSARDLKDWLKKGILQQNGDECLYFYSQNYLYMGEEKTRTGFITKTKIEEYEKRIICPHEYTLSKPKADRLELTRACEANFSQIFGLFSDPDKTIDNLIQKGIEGESLTKIKDPDGVVHNFGKITNRDIIKQLTSCMNNKKIFIADGHHRYETALAYRNEMRKKFADTTENKPYDYVLMYLTNMDSEGTSIFPIHRLLFDLDNFQPEQLLESLKTFFNIQKYSFKEPDEKNKILVFLLNQMKLKEKDQFTFGLYLGTQSFYLLTLKDHSYAKNLAENSKQPEELLELESFILHSLIIEKLMGIKKESIKNQENICYKKNEVEAVEMVDSGKYQLAFFLNPTPMEQIKKLASASVRMPQKSTYFFPKLLSGLVINPLTS